MAVEENIRKCSHIFYESLCRLSFWRAICCEIFATAIYVLIGCTATVFNLNENATISSATSLRIALTYGFTVNVLIKIFGPVSGCHINPAVTLALTVVGKISLIRSLFYLMAQMMGATIGAAALFVILPPKHRVRLGATKLFRNVTLLQGIAIEAALTFILVMTIFACLDSKKRIDRRYKIKIANPLTVGLAYSCLHLVGVQFTGASMNPARSFGPAILTQRWNNHWVYWVGPLIGACLATLVFQLLIAPYDKTFSDATDDDDNMNSSTNSNSSNISNDSNNKCCNHQDSSIGSSSSCSHIVDVPLLLEPACSGGNIESATVVNNNKLGYNIIPNNSATQV